MRPDISDSLTSGQPLYLLYSYSNRGPAAGPLALALALATQAIGSVRLQVTGRPPTISAPGRDRPEQDSRLPANAAAMPPCSTCLRRRKSLDCCCSLSVLMICRA